MAKQIGGVDGDVIDAAQFLQAMMVGMGDKVVLTKAEDGSIRCTQSGLRVVRGLESATRQSVLACWIELWRGAVHSHRLFIDAQGEVTTDDTLTWTIMRQDPANRNAI
jgi:hypothetical protein